MTAPPRPHASQKKLGLVIDLDTCVGCQACATSCKEWRSQGSAAPLSDYEPYGAAASGVWLNRVHGYEQHETGQGTNNVVNFPRSCLHCAEPACVTVCPTGASYKHAEDGTVLVDPNRDIGSKLCSWACPYGAREYDEYQGVMKKCTLCVDRLYNANLQPEDPVPACVKACPTGARHFGDLGDATSPVSQLVASRGGYDLLPEMGYQPTNKYLPPRKKQVSASAARLQSHPQATAMERLFIWADELLTSTQSPTVKPPYTEDHTHRLEG